MRTFHNLNINTFTLVQLRALKKPGENTCILFNVNVQLATGAVIATTLARDQIGGQVSYGEADSNT